MAQQKHPRYPPTEIFKGRTPTVPYPGKPILAIFERPEKMLGKTKFRQILDLRHLKSEQKLSGVQAL